MRWRRAEWITAVLDGRAETEAPEVTGNGTGFGKAIRRMHKGSCSLSSLVTWGYLLSIGFSFLYYWAG